MSEGSQRAMNSNFAIIGDTLKNGTQDAHYDTLSQGNTSTKMVPE